jgi:hypothetical protein
VIAEEMARGVQTAVDCWMKQIDSALSDSRLTTLGRLNAVHEIVQNYKLLTGKVQFDSGESVAHAEIVDRRRPRPLA